MMNTKWNSRLNGLLKTPYDLKLTPILAISLLNVAMALGTIVKIETENFTIE